jgi:hypothetical protein
LTPEQGGVLLAEAVQDEHKAAWLARAAADGFLDIDGQRLGCWLVRRQPPEQAECRDPWTAAEVGNLFRSRKRVSLGGYDPPFAATWGRIGDRLENWRASCGLWDPAGDRRRVAAWGSAVQPRWRAWSSWSSAPSGPAARARHGRISSGPAPRSPAPGWPP